MALQILAHSSNGAALRARATVRGTDEEEWLISLDICADAVALCRLAKEMDYNGLFTVVFLEFIIRGRDSRAPWAKLVVVLCVGIMVILSHNLIIVFAYDFLIASESVQDMKVDRHSD